MANYNFTRQEAIILKMICEGEGTREILAELRIADDTLKRHLTNIYDKTGVDNRVQLVLFAIAKGLWVVA
jgi:DNA-binding NarL/FixJ family response regulator